MSEELKNKDILAEESIVEISESTVVEGADTKKKKAKKISLKKKDWVLIGIIITVALLSFLMHHTLQNTGSGYVIIRVNGAIEGTYDLIEDQEISINNGSNILVLNNGKADMIEADCPDKLCVHQRAISKNHESITCLPNRISVEIKSANESQTDAMTN